MDERSTGIILRTRPFTETSLTVQWLTPDLGRFWCIAKGARRPKSAFAGKLDLFFEADFSFQRSRRTDLHLLKEISLLRAHGRLREELSWPDQAAYFTVLIEQATEPESPIEELYLLMRDALQSLPQAAPRALSLFTFEVKFLTLLGYQPNIDESALSKSAQTAAHELRERPWKDLRTADYPAAVQSELRAFLRTAVGTALEKLPAQREKALRDLGG